MNDESKINVLVITDLFPKFKDDVQGVFVIDYLKSLAPYCNLSLLFVRISGQKKGLSVEQEENYTVYRYCLSDKKIASFLKPFYYIGWFIKGYKTGLQFKEAQLIHSHGTILSGTLAWLLSRKLKIPFIITEHQGPFTMLSATFWKRNWTRFTMQKANRVLAVSEHLKKEILDTNIHPKKLVVTYNPVDTHLFQPASEKNIKHNLLFAGRLDSFKGGFKSLQAFHSISSKYPDWTMTLVGDGEDMPKIKNFLDKHPELKTRVHLKGQLVKAGIAHCMRQADFLVNPSKHESFGLVIAEALSTGLPVIVGDKTAPLEFVNNSNGILVDVDNAEQIAHAMEMLITNLQHYNPANIRNEIITRFGFENFGKVMLQQYREVLNNA